MAEQEGVKWESSTVLMARDGKRLTAWVLCVSASVNYHEGPNSGWLDDWNLTETTPRLQLTGRRYLRVSLKQALCLIPFCSSSFWHRTGSQQTSGWCCWFITDGKNAGRMLGSCPKESGNLWIFHSQLPLTSFAQVHMHVTSVFDDMRFNICNRTHWTKM